MPRCNVSRNSLGVVVFNGRMKRAVTALAAAILAAVLVPAAASAANIEIGVTASPIIAPTCPANAQGSACAIVLTHVTAYENAA